MEEKESYSVREVAEMLGVREQTVRNWRKSGWISAKLVGHGRGRHFEILKSDLEAFMSSHDYERVN